ncbi:hypothetical protein [Dokdonella sp.]|uniref:hypothetical protein n=1 Tax=Dokdonella sp. TaxID=2291710 RepID=UPI0035285CFD
MKLQIAAALALALNLGTAQADHNAEDAAPVRADSHAPIGVMGDHLHRAGEWMISYRYMHMDMQGNRTGTDDISPDEIVTTQSNPFAGMPGMPPTLRVVPLDMQMDMNMFGAMYGLTDRLTLMAMINYVDKQMKHRTYAGGMGTNVLGNFETSSSGFADSTLSALIGLGENAMGRWHANVGVSLPTGSVKEKGQVLAPNGMEPVLRLPYPMQLGSGTTDPILGLTVTRQFNDWSWGAQWTGLWHVTDNNEDYRLGDQQRLTAWVSRLWTPSVSTSLRLAGQDVGEIRGQDPQIMAPVQTADPSRQGGQRIELGIGMNYAAQGSMRGNRLAVELLLPVYQRLHGPQLETDWQLVAGYQYAF